MGNFNALGLSHRALKATQRLGYTEPSPVQEQAIPLILQGRDVIAAAQTGTGKTAAFVLPCIDLLAEPQRGMAPRMLVITPTRELADQIALCAAQVAKSFEIRVTSVVGGVSYNPQIQQLNKGTDVLIATPGRLEDLISQGAADLSRVEKLVLDEADRMLDMGFLPQVRRIIQKTPRDRQTLLFSATIDGSIAEVAKEYLNDPATVEIARKGETAENVEQFIARIEHVAKPALLAAVLDEYPAKRVIVFARTRHRADACARRLRKAGHAVEVIHSDRTQSQRRNSLDRFSAGESKVLVATDVLARGIDVQDVDYVVNYDIPTQPEDYVHRIGRTGRADARGWSVSFVSPENEADLAAICKLIKRDLPELPLKNFDRGAAEAEAAERTMQRNVARQKDPEVAAAVKEMKSREKAKRKAAAKRAEERMDPIEKAKRAAARAEARVAAIEAAERAEAAKAAKAAESAEPATKPTDKPSGKPASKPSGKATSKPSGKPASKTSGKPAGKPASKTSGKPAGKPASKSSGKPVSKVKKKALTPIGKASGKAALAAARKRGLASAPASGKPASGKTPSGKTASGKTASRRSTGHSASGSKAGGKRPLR